MIKRIFTASIIFLLCSMYTTFPQRANTTKNITEHNNLPGFSKSNFYNEQIMQFNIEPEIAITINAPSPETFNPSKKIMLVLYALPNFNTTAQTIGRKLHDNDDWHFNIQHIGAQTRFLRQQRTEYNIVVAYLETGRQSWPWWRNSYEKSDTFINTVVDTVESIFNNYDIEIVLDGHSGGGSFILGYINSVKSIPDKIKRIAFLDSNYDFENTLSQGSKIIRWLKSSNDHFLNIICYNDQGVKENGEEITTPITGTFYKTNLMKSEFETQFIFVATQDTAYEIYDKYSALEGRLQIIFVHNPKKLILHTVLVERNGFIESINSGTIYQGINYIFMGALAYEQYITN